MLDEREREGTERKPWREAAEDVVCVVIGNAVLLSLGFLVSWPIVTAIGKIIF
ncbi:hypothetical protein [Kaistia algarum]|uniref:hypothetical protein n=1 Tax=Kaistia algarum TaxID=2083279 RepID=UPI0014021ED8|nr:hypothetical protein [Kaistia algarum]MCX5516762.1 hypothetical protein [Kaistia algarum]